VVQVKFINHDAAQWEGGMTLDNFRLLPGAPGKAAGKDGKDLGADVDLIGPGAAYERWQKTPAYQQWQGQVNQIRGGVRPIENLQGKIEQKGSPQDAK
jgi:hypothetical protein